MLRKHLDPLSTRLVLDPLHKYFQKYNPSKKVGWEAQEPISGRMFHCWACFYTTDSYRLVNSFVYSIWVLKRRFRDCRILGNILMQFAHCYSERTTHITKKIWYTHTSKMTILRVKWHVMKMIRYKHFSRHLSQLTCFQGERRACYCVGHLWSDCRPGDHTCTYVVRRRGLKQGGCRPTLMRTGYHKHTKNSKRVGIQSNTTLYTQYSRPHA